MSSEYGIHISQLRAFSKLWAPAGPNAARIREVLLYCLFLEQLLVLLFAYTANTCKWKSTKKKRVISLEVDTR